MNISRRTYLSLSAAAVTGLVSSRAGAQTEDVPSASAVPSEIGQFSKLKPVYLNAASQHPMPDRSRAAVNAYLDHKQSFDASEGYRADTRSALTKFANLMNADEDEITYVQSTTAGEHAVIRALGLPGSSERIVTDTLHFFGSLPLYDGLAKQGCDVAWVRARDNKIQMEDLDKAITPGTKLVSLSLVSTINGFQHDLKAVCDLAHSRGALVYADIIHAAGCVPVDLHESGVDFAACASYKWLMGDFGLGFLYVKKSVQEQLPRTNWGYYGINKFTTHIYPLDEPGDTIVDCEFSESATGHFANGTYDHVTAVQLAESLDYLKDLGIAQIQAHAKPLVERLSEGMKSQGFDVITPEGSETPIVAAAYRDAYKKLSDKMKVAGITTTVSRHRIRPSVSVFNTMDDVEAFLAALGQAE
ncbi:aminotransferase class V-fold PLP-dependent enzyme [Ponticaulis profundi]|uniref:Aminotransferase class V-fold PLP-dependent enzyme n=1 Tax=Ponticaulis profundi TaxID=2665222 RepID=A0ABW1S745_9PROT